MHVSALYIAAPRESGEAGWKPQCVFKTQGVVFFLFFYLFVCFGLSLGVATAVMIYGWMQCRGAMFPPCQGRDALPKLG